MKVKNKILLILIASVLTVGCTVEEEKMESLYGTLMFKNQMKQETFLLGKTEDFKNKFKHELKTDISDSVAYMDEHIYGIKTDSIYLGIAASKEHPEYMKEIVYSIKLPKDAKSFSDKEVQEVVNKDSKILEDLYNVIFEGNSEYYYKQTLKMMESIRFDIDNNSSAMLEISDDHSKDTAYISVNYLNYGNEQRIKIVIDNDTINSIK